MKNVKTETDDNDEICNLVLPQDATEWPKEHWQELLQQARLDVAGLRECEEAPGCQTVCCATFIRIISL